MALQIVGTNFLKYLAAFQYFINVLLALASLLLRGGNGCWDYLFAYIVLSLIISYLMISWKKSRGALFLDIGRWLAVINSLLLFWLLGPYRIFYFFNIMAVFPALVFTGVTLRSYLLLFGEILLLFGAHQFGFQSTNIISDLAVVLIHVISMPFVVIFQNVFKKQKKDVEENASKIEEKNRIIEQKSGQLMKDLTFAQKIQWNLLPFDDPHFKYSKIEFFYKPMEQLGGDFFDFLRMRESHLKGIFISDVSGHGVGAALITIMVKTLLEAAGKARSLPAELLSYINTKLYGKINDNFLTAFYAIYDEKLKILHYVNAGHNPPWCLRKGEILELEARGPVLGIKGEIFLEEKSFSLLPGDRIFYFTDGLTEASNAEYIQFEDTLKNIILENNQVPLKQLFKLIEYHLTLHTDGGNFDDDICLVGMEIL